MHGLNYLHGLVFFRKLAREFWVMQGIEMKEFGEYEGSK
jgi:hypothetical protein